MDCWKCGKKVGDGLLKSGFRAVCVHCDWDLHVCKNCRYYAPGKPNDCEVPGTEFIKDRERFNFCEEFKPRLAPPGSTESKKRGFGSLFKDSDPC